MEKEPQIFSVRERIRRWKLYAGIGHLMTVAAMVFVTLMLLPHMDVQQAQRMNAEFKNQLESRQMLMEAMDKLGRYQKYFHELNGRYTRDLSRLSMVPLLSSGEMEDLQKKYEISVLEVRPNRFLLLATGIDNSDRVTMDESYRINANFVLPPPSHAYLLEEAQRLLRIESNGEHPEMGVYSRYWRVFEEGSQWVALGRRRPVEGERQELDMNRGVASIFTSVRNQLKTKMQSHKKNEDVSLVSTKESLTVGEVNEWLLKARQAQHIYKRERGHYAHKWEDLDVVSNYDFSQRMKIAKNVRLNPIEIDANEQSFRMEIEGTSGDILGERFVIDQNGSVRQVRYTETLVEQLRETTDILNTLQFQVNPVSDDVNQVSQP